MAADRLGSHYYLWEDCQERFHCHCHVYPSYILGMNLETEILITRIQFQGKKRATKSVTWIKKTSKQNILCIYLNEHVNSVSPGCVVLQYFPSVMNQ